VQFNFILTIRRAPRSPAWTSSASSRINLYDIDASITQQYLAIMPAGARDRDMSERRVRYMADTLIRQVAHAAAQGSDLDKSHRKRIHRKELVDRLLNMKRFKNAEEMRFATKTEWSRKLLVEPRSVRFL